MNINDITAARPHWTIPEDAMYVRIATDTGRPIDLYKKVGGCLFYLLRRTNSWLPSTFSMWRQEKWIKDNILLRVERKQSINEKLLEVW